MASLIVLPLGLVLLISFTNISSLAVTISNETERDREALLCFKAQLSSPAEVFASWSNASLDFCNWNGVTCSAQYPRRVKELKLASEGIAGSVPPCIASLTSLTNLQLSNNRFHGVIPSNLGLLSQLSSLDLSMNSLEGMIPSELSSCTQLQYLNLSYNNLQGQIPSSLSKCRHLQEIDLSNNKLKGSIPSAFANLSELQTLFLYENRLSGTIPPSLGSSLSLRRVDLGSNVLTGGVPEPLANSSSLEVLMLMDNKLEGKLPNALFNTSSLIYIFLQKNRFVGHIPHITANSSPVKYLNLAENHLQGTIPSSIGNLSSLVTLELQQNSLVGSIPESIGNFQTLEVLDLGQNKLSGTVPPSLFKMFSLKNLTLSNNSFTGRLPSDIAYTLPNIEGLSLHTNQFEGPIPASLLNAYNLSILYLNNNKLTGFIPSFGSLPNLEELDLSYNMLDAGDWDFISSLSNCSRLTKLSLVESNLQGNLPKSIGNLSSSIKELYLSNNNISGPIPQEIGNLKNLKELYMDYNSFTENIPSTIGDLPNLVRLALAHNQLSGRIPNTIGNLVQLTSLTLDWNNLSGMIPATMGNCNRLEKLNLAHNSLNGSIPITIFKPSLSIEFNLSHNHLSGEIPEEVGNLINLNKLSISNNMLSGNIPSTLGKCVVLEYIEMQFNLLSGSIPNSFEQLKGVKELDISQNNLSGKIPVFVASLTSLQRLNISYNNFDGAIPNGGVFGNSSAVSIEGNDKLCATTVTGYVPLCSVMADRKRKHKTLVLVAKIVTPIAGIGIIISFCLVTFAWRKRMQANTRLQQYNEHMKNIAYKDILEATDRFSPANLIGSGSFGKVYKGNLNLQEDEVAIKVFNLETYGAHRSFAAECKALRNVRHRNIVQILTVCSSVDYTGADFKALVFPYMPHGNLEMWLHPKDHEDSKRKILTLNQRISIALDVASALDYLHNSCAPPLIHCDLKPSNILLDLDMAAHVTDFGLARFLYTRNSHQDCSESVASLKGSIGYIPPEYGMHEGISTKGDVYSFGVLLLEMISGSSPRDEKFGDGTNLHISVASVFPDNMHEIVDPVMLQDEIDAEKVLQDCIIPLARIGLSCSKTSPNERPGMGQVCTEILTIKNTLQA